MASMRSVDRSLSGFSLPAGSRRAVTLEDCTYHTGDDGIALKAGRDADAWRDGRPLANVVVRHCTFRSEINAFCIGSEISAGVRNIYVEDCRVLQGESCLYFKSNMDRGGFIEGVRVRRIAVERSHAAVIRFETQYHSYRGGRAPTRFRDFLIEDVTCARADAYGLFLNASPAAPIQGLVLRRVTLDYTREPMLLQAAAPVDFEDVRINGHPLDAHPAETPAGTPRLKIRI